ncbi:Outer membrane usher protein FimD [Halomonadaceae bacterium LMG 33818]|uniref:fimbria/pilus outer membrane usher protein n=1 Tax=Cernens ardua TaxID=3402176 RepID=UPI003EDC8914
MALSAQKRHLGIVLISIAIMPDGVLADEHFNTAFLQTGSSAATLASVEDGDNLLPGTYDFNVFLNGNQVDQRPVLFVRNSHKGVVPCLTAATLTSYGIRLPKNSALTAQCYPLEKELADTQVSYDSGSQQLDIDVAQIHLTQIPSGNVPHRLWDEGITAGLLSYDVTATHNEYSGQHSQNYFYMGLTSGFNIGAWRYRNRGILTSYTGSKTHWQTQSNLIERDLPHWRSDLQIGDTYTGNDTFDSVRFRGIQLSSDQDQLPASLQMYAPVVRGTAATNARVEIIQNGYTLYSTNVSPGPFALHDITPSSLSGTLHVRVIESNGSVHQFDQSYSAVPNMLREGLWRYQFSAGHYRNGGFQDNYHPAFIQLTAGRGMSSNLTPFGGILVAKGYKAANIGIGSGLGRWGAVSVDYTVANTHIATGKSSTGGSLRFLYSKSLNSWGTQFNIIGYRYSTPGYYDLSDAVSQRAQWHNGYYRYDYTDTDPNDYIGVPDWTKTRRRSTYSTDYYNKRSQLNLSLTQTLWNGDQVFINLSNQNYWHDGRPQRSWQLGYNGHALGASYGVFVQYTLNRFSGSQRELGFNISMPLGSSSSPTYVTASATHESPGDNSVQTGISGSALSDNRLNYSAQVGHSGSNETNGSLSGDYMGADGDINAGYSRGAHYSQTSLGFSGGAIIHGGGITFGRQLQSTTVLVHAKNADGVGVVNQQGVHLNHAGYAIIGGASAYRRNQIALNLQDIPPGLNISDTSDQVVPTRGAIVRANFATQSGQNVLIQSQLQDGSPLPLGGNIISTDHQAQGVVGPNGQAYVTGVENGQTLKVSWGEAPDQSCVIPVKGLPPVDKASLGYDTLTLECTPTLDDNHE